MTASLFLIVGSLAGLAFAQQRPAAPKTAPAPKPVLPTVRFELDFPGSSPERYSIVVDTLGEASYRVDPGQDPNAAQYVTPGRTAPKDDPYELKFTMSQGTRERIFGAAEKLDYFSGNFDYTKRKIASSGKKTLTYTDATRNHTTTYNWSENPTVDELTHLFQNMGQTLEFGRRLEYMVRYEKLGVDSELRRMEDAAKRNELVELQVIEPLLHKIADDSSMLHIARSRAKKLLTTLAQSGSSDGGETK